MNTCRQTERRGVTIVEVSVALLLLAAGLMATAQVLVLCARQRLTSDRVFTAQIEAANVGERIAAMPYEQLTASHLEQLRLSAESQSALPGGKLQVTVADLASDPTNGTAEEADQQGTSSAKADDAAADTDDAALNSKRIRIEVRWPIATRVSHDADGVTPGTADLPDHVVGLTVWKFAPGSETAP